MNAGAVWWGQIGNSLRLLSRVTESLRDHRTTLLQFPAHLPWRERFEEEIDLRRTAFSMDRRLRRLAWDGKEEPGAFILRKLCSPQAQARYWPGESYAAYLGGSRGEMILCDYDVWISGIREKEGLFDWIDFVSRYEEKAGQSERRAVFLLEYSGAPIRIASLDQIPYQVSESDCRVFCLEMASDMADNALRAYRAELALCVGDSVPELCAALLETGERLLAEPLSTALEILNRTDSPFPARTESEIMSAVWRAQVVLLFPVLERRRFDFIAKYETPLLRCLPIINSNGDQITEPFDLEIGALYYAVTHTGYAFVPQEVEEIRLCRRIRNLLAHNQPASYADVREVLAMEN